MSWNFHDKFKSRLNGIESFSKNISLSYLTNSNVIYVILTYNTKPTIVYE